jgi:hypothetical protein
MLIPFPVCKADDTMIDISFDPPDAMRHTTALLLFHTLLGHTVAPDREDSLYPVLLKLTPAMDTEIAPLVGPIS